MSVLDRIRGWSPRARRRRDAPPAGLVPADRLAAQARRDALRASAAESAVAPFERELLARRERLTERFALLQADLGGVFYEMAIRDHVVMDVLTRKAAELQRVDADLQQVERELRGEHVVAAPPGGLCPACGAAHALDARFCAHCGHTLAHVAVDPTAPTAVQRIARTNGAGGAAP
ncbi:MAG TPA: zinc ribbon domain-containing protein [Conexibacter sp.]